MKKAFTLVELLVVIGIVGILTSIIAVTMTGGSQSAMNVKCESNIRNLAAACLNYGMANSYYPAAGSFEKRKMDTAGNNSSYRMIHYEQKGWISWYSNGAYNSKPTSPVANDGWWTSTYEQDLEIRRYCLTNGAIWKYISANTEVYRCPCHLKKFPKLNPTWSYVMSSVFWWAHSRNERPKTEDTNGTRYGERFEFRENGKTRYASADRVLLFAEIPFMGIGCTVNDSTSAGKENDCVLQYEEKHGAEKIGFNHTSGKRDKYAIVAFADAHTERITWPRNGLSESNMKELTKWLCEGKDFAFDGKTYKEMK